MGSEKPSIVTAHPNFSEFWLSFKSALFVEDYERLAVLTQFPFRVRGVVDSAPVVQYSTSRFSVIMKKILSQPLLEVDVNGSLVEKTLLEDIKSMRELPALPKEGQNFMQIKQLQFEIIQGQWKMVEDYLE